MTNIVDLHENFLLQIFNYCNFEALFELSDTCKLFKEIIHRVKFQKVQQCSIRIRSASERYMMFKIPRCVGPYVIELDIKILDDDGNFLNSYFRMLGRYVGSNVRKMNLNGLHMTMELFEPIKPVLKRLTELENLHFTGHSMKELQTICPVLERLSFRPFMNFSLSPKTWSSLTSVSLKYLDLNLKKFRNFVVLNPQIIDLEVAVEDGTWLKVISKNLPNLEALAFHECSEYYVTTEDMRELRRLTQLTKISLPSPSNDSGDFFGYRNRSREYGLKEFLLYLTRFTQLREIKFNDNFNHSEAVSSSVFEKLASRLKSLEVFHFPLCNPHPRAIIEFVRHAKALKEIYIGLENDDFDDAECDEKWMWTGLVTARKSHQSEGAAPLKFIMKTECSIDVAVKDFGEYLCIEAPPNEF